MPAADIPAADNSAAGINADLIHRVNVGDSLTRTAARTPDAMAVVDGDRRSGGENVASIEVEKAVYAADENVAEAVVAGLPHDRWGEAVTAIVVPKPGTTIDEERLIDQVKQLIDPYKAPKSVIVTDALPRTSTGKIQKDVVREKLAGHYGRA